jgi:hypothetical protein
LRLTQPPTGTGSGLGQTAKRPELSGRPPGSRRPTGPSAGATTAPEPRQCRPAPPSSANCPAPVAKAAAARHHHPGKPRPAMQGSARATKGEQMTRYGHPLRLRPSRAPRRGLGTAAARGAQGEARQTTLEVIEPGTGEVMTAFAPSVPVRGCPTRRRFSVGSAATRSFASSISGPASCKLTTFWEGSGRSPRTAVELCAKDRGGWQSDLGRSSQPHRQLPIQDQRPLQDRGPAGAQKVGVKRAMLALAGQGPACRQSLCTPPEVVAAALAEGALIRLEQAQRPSFLQRSTCSRSLEASGG